MSSMLSIVLGCEGTMLNEAASSPPWLLLAEMTAETPLMGVCGLG